MLGRRIRLPSLLAFAWLATPCCDPGAWAADKGDSKDGGKIAGILMDKGDDWMTVKADGDDEPTKYVVDASDKKLREVFKTVFNACRVQLTYKQDGDVRKLVSIKRHIIKEKGTITGEVVKVHNDFWVEVKPKRGVADAFAPGANYNDKNFMERLKALQPGDSVTISYTTDFERHRITSLRKNPASPPRSTARPSAEEPTEKPVEKGPAAKTSSR